MEALQAIRQRKSYRGKFKADPVPREDLREILEAGFLAPSGCNMQTTKLIGVDDPELVGQLAQIYGNEWATTAPAAIVLVTKYTLAPSGVSYHVHDYSAATENILLAVEEKGYATTWIEGQIHGAKAAKMGEILGVPDDMQIVVYLPLGIPCETVRPAVKVPFAERAWFNRYGGGEE